ncbi:Uncharacterized protein APZ42_007536 [Daphnia magna]|uniref:Uncharacterized protein n=1 Tax=Daphnia magna TaxID=35525 RepID=A0A164F893_9CRUS|nr:Uncharacterized protein APZ42_007536 [Daphnia magna]
MCYATREQTSVYTIWEMGSQTVQSPSILIGISFSKIGSVESGYSCILHSGALDFHMSDSCIARLS